MDESHEAACAAKLLGYQRWCDILFVHWPVEPSMLEPLLPRGLAVDTWQGGAWIGLVAFRLCGVRPWWAPALPILSSFVEVNVRTYVRCAAGGPGVWFFSMDAASTLAVLVARYRWHFNYQRSRMRFRQQGRRLFWSSRRVWPGPRGAFLNLEAEIGPREVEPAQGFEAQPASLDHFLIERYVYYSLSKSGRVARGFVAHDPYRLVEARVVGVRQSLTDAVGVALEGPPVHACYSAGVASMVYPPVVTGN